MSKRQIREVALRERRSLSDDEVRRLSEKVRENLVSLPEFRRAKMVASYVAKGDEVQTADILRLALESGKKVIVPRSHPSSTTLSFHEIESLGDLHPGTFSVLEPSTSLKTIPLSESDLVLVPVVAWDEHGHRLGYGKGYFDRELRMKGEVPCAGLAFEVQQRDMIPADTTDVPLDMIVTERRVVRFKEGKE